MSHFERFLSCVLGDARITEVCARAYVIATVRHESDRRWYTKNPADIWVPCDEIGEGKGKPYGIPVGGQIYYGRGFCQMTWIKNYRLFSDKLGVDLVSSPALANEYETAYNILSIGMAEGLFTGEKLSDFFVGEQKDYAGARRIVNGVDRKDLIAGYAVRYERLLRTIQQAGS